VGRALFYPRAVAQACMATLLSLIFFKGNPIRANDLKIHSFCL
jgi:hypothetical protein